MKTHRTSICASALLAIVVQGVPALGLDIAWYTVDGGGAMHTTGGAFDLTGSIGQPDAGGPMTGGGFSLVGGFLVAATTPTPGDCDFDGDVDLADYASFGACLHGPAGGGTPNCNCLDFDNDGDADLADFAKFQLEIGGP